MWKIVFSKQAQKDAQKAARAGLRQKIEPLLETIRKNPYDATHHFERLRGDLEGFYSRRITIKHRLVYEVHDDLKIVRIVRMWTHYE